MKLQEAIRRLQTVYNSWGDIDICIEIPYRSPYNVQGLVRYEVKDVQGFGPVYVDGECVHDEKIVALMGEEWNWRGTEYEALLDAPD